MHPVSTKFLLDTFYCGVVPAKFGSCLCIKHLKSIMVTTFHIAELGIVSLCIVLKFVIAKLKGGPIPLILVNNTCLEIILALMC